MQKTPRIINAKIIASTRLFRIEQLDLLFTNGNVVQYERLVGAPDGAVLVVPMLNPDTVLLIREYAAGVDRYELALPKGRMEAGETVLEAANRELMEETGYGARRLQHVTALTLAPNYLSHMTQIVLAQDLYEQRRSGDEPEEIEVIPWPLSRLGELIQRDDCTEARSLAALFIIRELITQETMTDGRQNTKPDR